MTLSNGSTATTDANGYYAFTGLNCFTSYVVSYVESTPYVPNSSQFEQSTQETNIMEVSVPASSFNPLADSISPDNNFGLTPLCELNGHVYLDVNMNDLYDSGVDTILSGVAMSLDGVSNTVTDANGYYSFTGTNCFVSHTVSYTNNTPYISDSAQFEQTSQQTPVTSVVLAL